MRLAGLVAFSGISAGGHAAPLYRIIELPDFEFVTAVNSSGTVVGSGKVVTEVGERERALVWSNGVAQTIGTLEQAAYRANGIGDTGVIVGASGYVGGAPPAPFIYRSGTLSYLATTASNATAEGVSDSGDVVVGQATFGWPIQSALTWDASGQQSVIDTGTTISVAYAVNDSGVVVGFSAGNASSERPFRFDGTTVVELESPFGQGLAADINNSGVAVGWTGSGAPLWPLARGAVWSMDGGVRLLEPLAGCIPSYVTSATSCAASFATGINDLGIVVGRTEFVSESFSVARAAATLWDGNGDPVDLWSRVINPDGWSELYAANDISNAGHIVGSGQRTGSIRSSNFLLVPVPLPAAVWLFVAALSGLVGLRFGSLVVKTAQ